MVPCYSTRFGLYFMQLESKMRVLKIWIPSVNSVGCEFYPQNELLNGFCQFDQLGCCLRSGNTSKLPLKNIKSKYLRVFFEARSFTFIKYPQYDHKYQVFDVLVTALGRVCDETTMSHKRTPNAVTLSIVRQVNVYGSIRPSFMLSSISPLKHP